MNVRRRSEYEVVMGVQANLRNFSIAQMATEPFDLVGVHIGCCHFDGCWQIEDDWSFWRGLPDVDHGFADFQGEVEFGC